MPAVFLLLVLISKEGSGNVRPEAGRWNRVATDGLRLAVQTVALCLLVLKHQQWLRWENWIYWDSPFGKSRAWDSRLFLGCSFTSLWKSELQVSVSIFSGDFPSERTSSFLGYVCFWLENGNSDSSCVTQCCRFQLTVRALSLLETGEVFSVGARGHMYVLSLTKKQVDIFLVREMWLLCFLSITALWSRLPRCPPLLAYFSPTDGAKLLSTDQRNEIRVYSCSDWTKPQHLIPHPHRQFQHLTPIKVS